MCTDPPAPAGGTDRLSVTSAGWGEAPATVAELAAALTAAGVTGRDPAGLAAEVKQRVAARRAAGGGSPLLPPPPGPDARFGAVIDAARLDGPPLPRARLAAAAVLLFPDHEVLRIATPAGGSLYEFTTRLAG